MAVASSCTSRSRGRTTARRPRRSRADPGRGRPCRRRGASRTGGRGTRCRRVGRGWCRRAGAARARRPRGRSWRSRRRCRWAGRRSWPSRGSRCTRAASRRSCRPRAWSRPPTRGVADVATAAVRVLHVRRRRGGRGRRRRRPRRRQVPDGRGERTPRACRHGSRSRCSCPCLASTSATRRRSGRHAERHGAPVDVAGSALALGDDGGSRSTRAAPAARFRGGAPGARRRLRRSRRAFH